MRARFRHSPPKIILAGLLALALCAESARGQMIPAPSDGDSVNTALLPVLGYTSDEGLIGGAVYNRIDYRDAPPPFRTYLSATALFTTKGFVQADGRYERTGAFGRELRSETEVFFHRLAANTYFGVGNRTTFSEELWEDEYYFFDDISAGLRFQVRRSLYREGEEGARFDLILGAGSEYHISYLLKEDSRFHDATPNGSEGGWVNLLKSGFVWENRDSEFDPRRGSRVDFDLRFAPPGLSAFRFTTASLTLRHYFRLLDFVTVAQRLQGRYAGGDVPYWELSTLGDESTLRGYPLNRFQGGSSLAYSLELRTWIVEFPDYGLKFGGQLFGDAGRVFDAGDDAGDLFGGYHRTFGFGGAMSVFNPDFILRGDIGFSEDVTRLYIGVGYMF